MHLAGDQLGRHLFVEPIQLGRGLDFALPGGRSLGQPFGAKKCR